MSRELVIALILALTLTGLGFVLRKQDAAEASEYLQPVLNQSERDSLRVAAVSFSAPGTTQEHLYLYRDGQWLCTSVYNAIALTSEIEALVGELAGSYAHIVADERQASAYGLASGDVLVTRLHGADVGSAADRDVLLELELGHSLSGLGAGRSFARIAGRKEIIEIDQNPRARLLTPSEKRLPPLLDERLLAGEWPDRGSGLERAFIDFTDGRSIEINSRVNGLPPGPGLPAPREWIATEDDQTARCLPYRIGAWQSFLYHVPYQGLSDPAAAQKRGLDQPTATITLIQVKGAPVELVIGRAAPSGSTFVLNKKTNLLCLLEKEHAELLIGSVERLCSTDILNPWEAWLPK
ncbi:MAG: hypothetical protein ACI8X5_001178 [Planctomycetota bacterium]|jgi:hypothetical protein